MAVAPGGRDYDQSFRVGLAAAKKLTARVLTDLAPFAGPSSMPVAFGLDCAGVV